MLRAVAVALIASLLAQTPAPQQTPVFRSSITVVPISVTVLDRKGQPVTDLRQEDFVVIENKKKCEVVNFFLQRYEAGAVPADAGAINRVRDESIKPQTRRTFLIMLGYGRIQEPTKALDGAIDLVRNRLLPQDAVAVMAYHRATNFTTDHEAIVRLLERYKKDHEKIVFDINEWIRFASSPYSPGHAPVPERFYTRIDDSLLGLADAGRSSSLSLRRVVDLLLGMDRAAPVAEKPWQRQDRFADLAGDSKDYGVDLSDAALRSSRLKLFAAIEYLRYLEGDKHLVVFANGGLVRNDRDRRADHDALLMVQRATDARVIVDMVATNGTFPRGGGGGDQWGREIVEGTGGFYSSLDMATKAVAKIDQGTRFSYLLGYEPTNPNLDGRYRDVEIKVNRPDVVVQYRHGYYAAADPPPLQLKELITQSRLETALSYAAAAKDIPLTVSAFALPKMGLTAEMRVELRIDGKPLALTEKDGRFTGQLEIQAYIGDAKENVIGEIGDHLDLDGDAAAKEQWVAAGIRRPLRVPFVGDAKYVKVVVYDYGSDKIGSFLLKLQ